MRMRPSASVAHRCPFCLTGARSAASSSCFIRSSWILPSTRHIFRSRSSDARAGSRPRPSKRVRISVSRSSPSRRSRIVSRRAQPTSVTSPHLRRTYDEQMISAAASVDEGASNSASASRTDVWRDSVASSSIRRSSSSARPRDPQRYRPGREDPVGSRPRRISASAKRGADRSDPRRRRRSASRSRARPREIESTRETSASGLRGTGRQHHGPVGAAKCSESFPGPSGGDLRPAASLSAAQPAVRRGGSGQFGRSLEVKAEGEQRCPAAATMRKCPTLPGRIGIVGGRRLLPSRFPPLGISCVRGQPALFVQSFECGGRPAATSVSPVSSAARDSPWRDPGPAPSRCNTAWRFRLCISKTPASLPLPPPRGRVATTRGRVSASPVRDRSERTPARPRPGALARMLILFAARPLVPGTAGRKCGRQQAKSLASAFVDRSENQAPRAPQRARSAGTRRPRRLGPAALAVAGKRFRCGQLHPVYSKPTRPRKPRGSTRRRLPCMRRGDISGSDTAGQWEVGSLPRAGREKREDRR
ncbi:hypothetical protein Q5P01_000781 [Channa striata]|uniref:Uncharacterized protein n=1 Tax=Channa striata TaxID=64152 RepID=A0AA88II00_CHASR|nr:hypothetical protein Q5P01_000781 [Channa striata]